MSVHPRACGEHKFADSLEESYAGSSPRLRGTCHQVGDDKGLERFIPAPAGNMVAVPPDADIVPVHPRACGEHFHRILLFLKILGSSPRLRGTCGGRKEDPRLPRFIPAPAGNMIDCGFGGVEGTVHPRACGEHLADRPQIPGSTGSSPRLRGTFNV